MPSLRTIRCADQRVEAWANGAGTTTVVLREPDSDDWRIRTSVARVDVPGPFSELPDTRRVLVPLDASITLQFPDGDEVSVDRFGQVGFAGTPAPTARLPEGPTRDFNLMLRGSARGEVFARTLADSMFIPHAAGDRWLVYLVAGHATLRADAEADVALEPGDAALAGGGDPTASRVLIRGAGEIILVRLYA